MDEQTRRREIGTDPVKGRFSPEEELAAIELEKRTATLRRDPSGDADWIDGIGQNYDAVGPVPTIMPPGWFALASFLDQIVRHARKADFAVVDVRNLSQTDRDAVTAFVAGMDERLREKVIIQPT
jgi:hypothetical protein